MRFWIAFWNILLKDMRTYYVKPLNLTWGLIFPLVWTGMFFIKSGSGLGSIPELLPGVVAVSILFGTTSVPAITVTFEKKNRSFERLLLAPIPLELLMLTKTGGAILFGVANAFVPVVMAAFIANPAQIAWAPSSSPLFRFPMMFLCGLFFPIEHLPLFLRPNSYGLPLTYGAYVLHGAVHGDHFLPISLSLAVLMLF